MAVFVFATNNKPDNVRSGERLLGIFDGARARIDPRMFQNTFGAEPLVGFLHQQSPDQIFRVFRDALPLVVRKFVPALLNTGKQKLLASLAVLSSLPTAVGAAIPVEWWITAEENVHNYAEAPQVATFVVIICLPDESFDNFRCHEISTADWRQKLRRRHGA